MGSRIYKELLHLDNKKISNPIKNGQKIGIDISEEKIHKWPISTSKRYPNIIIVKSKLKPKEYYDITIRIAKIKNIDKCL